MYYECFQPEPGQQQRHPGCGPQPGQGRSQGGGHQKPGGGPHKTELHNQSL